MVDQMPAVDADNGFQEARSIMPVDETGRAYSLAEERRRDGTVCFTKKNIVATQYAIFIDLSDTVNFPHDKTGRIDLTSLYIQIDKDVAALGGIAVGVITRVDGTNADITYFQGYSFEVGSPTLLYRDRKYSPSQLKTAVVSGDTPFIVSNEKELSVAAINTGITIDSVVGQVTPEVGDVIIKFTRNAGSFNAALSCHYHSESSAATP